MEFAKNGKYSFKVKGTRRNGANLYYIIDVNGWESYVKAYEFQKQNMPSDIICICRGFNESGTPTFMQDIATLILQLYRVGDVGDFKVKNTSNGRGYYDVMDENGFCFRLVNYGNEKLYPNQSVKCRITYINRVRVEMELVSGSNSEGLPMYSIDNLLSLDHEHLLDKRLMKKILALPAFSEMHRYISNGNPLWIIKMVEIIDANLELWITKYERYRKEALGAFINICVNLLENSDYFKQSSKHEKAEYQNLLSSIIGRAEDYRTALDIAGRGESEMYIEETLGRLKKSGYLYNAESRMRIAMSLFSLQSKTMRTNIKQIFDIIKEKHTDMRFMQLFSSAFIQTIDVFLRPAEEDNTLMATTWDRMSIQTVVEALAIQLLLTSNMEHGDINQSIYRSMLYRYASLLVNVDENVELLILKAYNSMFGQFSLRLEFGWDDLSNITLFCSKLATRVIETEPSADIRSYEGNNAVLHVSSDKIDLMPSVQGDNMCNMLPGDIFVSTPLNIYLNGRLTEKPSASKPTLHQYRRMWYDIENDLFDSVSTAVVKPRDHRISPDIGDEVYIRITGQSLGNPYEFNCRIEDQSYIGIGTINPCKQIVSYAVKATMDSFRDPETGKPYLLRANVEGVDEKGYYTFSMREGIARFNLDTLDRNIEHLAQITRVDTKQYLCIARAGVTLFLLTDKIPMPLQLGDFVYVDIVRIYPDGNIQASVVAMADEQFDRVDAFNNLIADYADGRLYDGPETENQTDDTDKKIISVMPAQYLRELIWVIDRMGMLQQDHKLTYNYLALARVLCRIKGDLEKADYYARRMELIMILNEFGETGKIDDDTIDTLLSDNLELIIRYPDIAHRLTQLKIVNQLDNPRQTEFLWEKVNQTDNKDIGVLAKFVLAHNLLDGNNAYELRKELKRKIFRLLDLYVPVPDDSVFVANEDQFTELKASIIYPANKDNKMYANERLQLDEICKIVCSFINAKGGTLYIGVNDLGNAIGLDHDFVYLSGGHREYDLLHVKDVFDRKVRDTIHGRLGVVANNLITSSFEEIGGKIIYRVDIDPGDEIVFLKGQAYVRQGTSKHVIPDHALPYFQSQREQLQGKKTEIM